MSTPNDGESDRAPAGPSLGKESQRGGNGIPIEVASNQTPSIRIDDSDNVEVQSHGDGVEDSNCEEIFNFKSVARSHFKRLKVNGSWEAECNYCHRKLGGDTKNGTSHLLKHFSICPLRKSRDIKQAILNPIQVSDGKTVISTYTFDQEAARNYLVKMIILHEYSLFMVEHHGFIEFCNTLQPLFKKVCRNTVKADILKIYEHDKSKTMELLDRKSSRFAITTDMWTSSNKMRGFMAVTANYIDDSWTLQSRIVRFIYVPCPHTSEVLADVLMDCLLDWNLDLISEALEKVRDSGTQQIFDDGAVVEIEKVRNLGFDMLKAYQASEKHLEAHFRNEFHNASSSRSQKGLGKDDLDEYDLFISSTSSNALVKSELDYYLEESVLPRVENFDILAWWKSNGPKYPTLLAMTRDILVIPVSTVASESAFSTNDIFLSPHRSRLHPKALKALMCAQDWLWTKI
ncbi:hypothetical protein OROMI_024669 [Orobanche minor]